MRRRGLWAAGVIVLVVGVVGVLVVGTGFANDEDANDNNASGAKCSKATLKGRYLFAYDGVQGKKQAPLAVAGQQVFNANGTQHGVASFNAKGKVFSNQRFSGTYSVKADCSGTITTDGRQSDMFIAPGGGMFTWVYSDPGFVASGPEVRVRAKRVGE
jgi:hypothetical protein